MAVTVALAGDTMLGRSVARTLARTPRQPWSHPRSVAVLGEADLVLLNLECCISERGRPWPAPGKPFFFRAPPRAVELLVLLGTDCVTLANNHALDYGLDALADTLDHLAAAGIAAVGAGPDLAQARRPACWPPAGSGRGPGGYRPPARLRRRPRPPRGRLRRPRPSGARLAAGRRSGQADAEVMLVTPHWGPNMTTAPVRHVRRAATALVEAGATLVAGHSAHVPHGVAGPVLYDLGDFLDDYRVDPRLRNDLGLLFLVTLDGRGPIRLEALPLKLEYCHTRLATGDRRRLDAPPLPGRLRRSWHHALEEAAGRLLISWR